ncbi:phosphatase 2C-like domain-containing protein [Pavlovales sp. CCMP2436]|nr:phosphatase 2C-like domain-containing protein [Pavlovales sp. CCMP2436]
MGNFLETPLTEKTTHIEEDEGKREWVGMSCMQGWRAQMEDDHLITLSLPEASDVSLFGVFDGHGGDHVAHYTAKHVQRHLLSAHEFKPPLNAQNLGAAFSRAILALDADLRAQPEHVNGHDQSGSTLTMVAITPTEIICANTGDSRSVLSRGGTAIDLSNDHKPFLEEEKTRIERAGGHVKFNRVNGDLAVSRALGDFAYKQRDDLSAEVQAVTALPELMSETRQAEDDFVILACDGIWDVMSSQECVNFVNALLRCSER